jgi:hypothetical protein
MAELRITGDTQALEELREALYKEIPNVDLQEINEMKPGELGEASLEALIVDLGGPELTRSVVEVIEQWMKHREKMELLRLTKFYLEQEGKRKEIALRELAETPETLKPGQGWVRNLVTLIVLLAIGLTGFYLLEPFPAVLWFLFVLVATPVVLAFVQGSETIRGMNLLELYRTGVAQIPFIGQLLSRLFGISKQDTGG